MENFYNLRNLWWHRHAQYKQCTVDPRITQIYLQQPLNLEYNGVKTTRKYPPSLSGRGGGGLWKG